MTPQDDTNTPTHVRTHRHARATGKDAWAAELEEEMKMMRFRWGEPEDEQLS